jgi:hypothetical protein
MPVKSAFRNIEALDKFLADWMRVEVAMPGRFNREPEFRASEPE